MPSEIPPTAFARALPAVAWERAHQKELGYDDAADDGYVGGELGQAAAAYLAGDLDLWPFDASVFNAHLGPEPTLEQRIEDVTRGAALAVAELDRLLREAQRRAR